MNQKNNFRYTTAIRKIRGMKKRIKVIPGGSSAGKTIAILMILIDKAIKTPNLSISVVSENIPHLKRGAIRDFLKIMKGTNRFISPNWNISNSIYTFTNGSYIEFFGADNDGKLRGARRDILYVNEANGIDYEAYLQLAIRTTGDIYLDYNPSNKFWVNNELSNDDNVEFLTLTYKDNEALSIEIVKQLESYRDKASTSTYWDNWVKVYLDGEIGSVEGTIYQDYKIIDTIPDEAKLLGYGLDFGYSTDPAALIGIYKYNDELIVDELIYQTGLLNSELSNMMKQNKISGEIFADSAEPKSIAELKRMGHQIKPVEKGRDSINYGIQILQQQTMSITKRSNNLLNELSKYMWKKNKDGGYDNTPIDAYNHGLDALRYVAMMKLGARKEGSRKPVFRMV
jgi:phage terminase large subunit